MSDPELILNALGELISLYKRNPSTGQSTGKLLTPEQVAKCVKFIWLDAVEVDGFPRTRALPYVGQVRGLKVNVIGGATGTGKTSLIQIMAGGMETSPKSASDTKCPSVYLFKLDGSGQEVFALLDTAGLCDTAADAGGDIGMQELLINAVAATVRLHKLEIVSFLMCVDVAGRLPGNFAAVWPQMQISLGGDRLSEICRFVVTKANGGSKVDNMKLNKLPNEEFYKELVYSPLKWQVTHAGRENLEGIRAAMQPINTSAVGVGADSVDPSAQSLATKTKICDQLEAQIAKLKLEQAEAKGNKKKLEASMDRMNGEVVCAYEELDKMDEQWCPGEEKKQLKNLIDDKKRELVLMKKKFARGESSEEELVKSLNKWDDDFQKQMTEIRKMHGIGAFFKTLVGGVVSLVT